MLLLEMRCNIIEYPLKSLTRRGQMKKRVVVLKRGLTQKDVMATPCCKAGMANVKM
jgi:hypothetical protein